MPRRWCKTMNATMLCFFLQEEVDSEGKRLKDQFASSERSFLHPMASTVTSNHEKEGFLKTIFANYTVIYASFGNWFGNDFKQMKANFAEIVQEVYFEHYYLKNVMQKSLERKEDTFLEYFMTKFENVIENRAEETDLIHSFRFLSKLLNLHFKRKLGFCEI
uniref:Uncharacterized protein n=1 Tax=Ditylenchus dipsaci TaxID=166011 RepID=A0A915DEY9_9BILA